MQARRAATTGGAASYVRISVTYVASSAAGSTRPPRRSTRQQRRRREDSAHPLGELAPPAAVCEGEGRPGGEGGRLRRPKLARRPPDEDSATVAARSDAARRDAERQRQPLRVRPLLRGSGPELAVVADAPRVDSGVASAAEREAVRAAGRHGGAAGRQLEKLRRGGARRSGARGRAERLCGESAPPRRGGLASALAPRPAAAASRLDALAPAVDAPVLEQRHRPVGAGRGGHSAAAAQRRHRAGRGQAARLRAGQEREAERACGTRRGRVVGVS